MKILRPLLPMKIRYLSTPALLAAAIEPSTVAPMLVDMRDFKVASA